MLPFDTRESYAFVGRDREFNALKSALSTALSGRSRVVLLTGEPGIGKTRTAQELAAHAEEMGACALWGRCYEGQGSPSYWPWIQIIRTYVKNCDAERLGSELGVAASDIAEVVPDIRQVVSGLGSSSVLDPEQARFRFFDSVASFLDRASNNRPLMIILDDLHWADRPSLLLLEFLAQSLQSSGLLILGTYRDIGLTRQHPLASTLGGLNRQPNFLRVPLGGIERSAIQSLVHDALGYPPNEQIVQELDARSQGNPLFLTEMVRLLLSENESSSGSASQGTKPKVPEGVKDVIHRRLSLLSELCCEALTVASVVGNEFDLVLIEMLMEDRALDEIVGLMEEAVAARVVEELPEAVGRYRFTHVLIQDTLVSEQPSIRRANLHERVAGCIEKMHLPNVGVHAAEIVHHLAQSVSISDSEMLVKYSALAGEQALSTYAYEDAVDYFQQALDTLIGDDSSGVLKKVSNAETAAILFGLGKAQGATGMVLEAWASLERSFEFYCETRDVEHAVEVAGYPLFFIPGLRDTTKMAAQALQLTPSHSLEAGRLLARYGMLLNLETGDHTLAQEALEKALLIAQRDGDILLEIQALTNAADVDWYHTRWGQVISKSEKAIALARRVQNPDVEVWPHYLAATSYWYSMPGQKVDEHARAALELAQRVRNKGFLSMALALNASLAQCNGEWETAREILDRCLALSPYFFYPLCRYATLEFEAGNFQQGELYLERLLELMRNTPPGAVGEYTIIPSTIACAAYVSGELRRFDVAREAAQIVLSSPGVSPTVASDTYVGLGFLAVLEKDEESAKRQYNNLKSLGMVFMDEANTSMHRLLGLLAMTFGQPQVAAAHFEDALQLCRDTGYRPELAWVSLEYARLLLEGGSDSSNPQTDSRERGERLLGEGFTVAEELGMKPLLRHMMALKDRLTSQDIQDESASASELPNDLTKREVDVLRLVAAGKSNQQIADELLISVHTVIYHVRNIFSKTTASNRVEAASYAVQHKLVP